MVEAAYFTAHLGSGRSVHSRIFVGKERLMFTYLLFLSLVSAFNGATIAGAWTEWPRRSPSPC